MKKIFDKIIGSSPSDCNKLIEEINKLGTFENPTPNRGFFENLKEKDNRRSN